MLHRESGRACDSIRVLIYISKATTDRYFTFKRKENIENNILIKPIKKTNIHTELTNTEGPSAPVRYSIFCIDLPVQLRNKFILHVFLKAVDEKMHDGLRHLSTTKITINEANTCQIKKGTR